MSVSDVIIVAIVALLVLVCVRIQLKSTQSGCRECSSATDCAGAFGAAGCYRTDEMLSNVEAAFEEKFKRDIREHVSVSR